MLTIPLNNSIAQNTANESNKLIEDIYNYIVITDSSLSHVFQRLVNYKSQFIPSKLITLDTILHNQIFYGRDKQEKIRSFISFAYENWNTKFVLLGGDDSIIPHRKLHAEMINWQGDYIESEIPSDMYYGCLDGTWDDDNDFIFGEQEKDSTDDEADWVAEVFIGRAPVENSFEASIFVNKVISFETSKKPQSIQLHQSELGPDSDPSSWRIIEQCSRWIPKDIYTIEKFYSIFQNITVTKWVDSFNKGKLIIQHAGNGDANQYDLDNVDDHEVWRTQDISKLRNNFYPIHLTLACFSGDFTLDDSITEKMLLYPYGGISACIANSDYGATDGEHAHKYSGEFLERQFYEIFENKTVHLGKVNQKAKEYFNGEAAQNPKYRWCYYALNLLGDPESPIFQRRNSESSLMISVDDDFDESTPGWNVSRFNSIQPAIDKIEENGTVLVYNGDYHENIKISKSLYLFGTNRNFDDYEPYSGLTTLIGIRSENVVTITADNVYIDGLIIKESGKNLSGIYLNEVNQSHIYRSTVVSNSGNGIFLDASSHCSIFDSSISFNQKNGIFLQNSNYNTFEELKISYNKKSGILLNNSYENQILGLASSRKSPFNFYGSKILHKNQDLQLDNFEDLNKFIYLFLSEYSQDVLERLFYIPARPPDLSDNSLTYSYTYLINNNQGITIQHSFNNTLKHLWIETKNEGIGIYLQNSYSNYIISNFILKNDIGVRIINSSISNLILNNFYNNNNPIRLDNASGIPFPSSKRLNLIVGGNAILNLNKNKPMFQWIFFDGTNEVVFIDFIALFLTTGMTLTSLVLLLSTLLSKILPIQLLNSILTVVLLISLSSTLLLKYIKNNHAPPSFIDY